MQSIEQVNLVPEIRQQLDAIVGRIVAAVPTHEIILFGSYANGTSNENSDLDICVLTSIEGTQTPTWLQTIRRAIRPVTSLPVDLLLWPKSKFDRNLQHPSSFEQVIAKDGVRLYG